jgi:hypothetical protein
MCNLAAIRCNVLSARNVSVAVMYLLVMTAEAAHGCSISSMQLQQVSSDLTVVVTHRDNPIAGIAVEVVAYESGDRVFDGITDEHGTVFIHGLLLGRYFLTAAQAGIESGKGWIEVAAVPEAKRIDRFEFQWADWAYQTSRIAGTLSGLIPGNTGNELQDLIHPKQVTYSGVAMTLRNAFSDAEYRTVSDSTGFFIFDNVPDGIYVLTVDGGMMSIAARPADKTTLVVELTLTSNRNSLPLQLKDNGCYQMQFELAEE